MPRYAPHFSLLLLLIAAASYGGNHELVPITQSSGGKGRYQHPFATEAEAKTTLSIEATDAEITDWTTNFKAKEISLPIYLAAARSAKAKALEAKKDVGATEIADTATKLKALTDAVKTVPVPNATNGLLEANFTSAMNLAMKPLTDYLEKENKDLLRYYVDAAGKVSANRLLSDFDLNVRTDGADIKRRQFALGAISPLLDLNLKPLDPPTVAETKPGTTPTVGPTDPATKPPDTTAQAQPKPPGEPVVDTSNKPSSASTTPGTSEPGPVGVGPQQGQGVGTGNAQANGFGTGTGTGLGTGTGTGSRGAGNGSGSGNAGGSSSSGGSGGQPPGGGGGGGGGGAGYQSTNKGTQPAEAPKPVQLTTQEIPGGPPPPQIPEGLNPRKPEDERRDVTDLEKSISERTQAAIQAMAAGVNGAIQALKSRQGRGLETQTVEGTTNSTKFRNYAPGSRSGSTLDSVPRARTTIAGRRTPSPYSTRKKQPQSGRAPLYRSPNY